MLHRHHLVEAEFAFHLKASHALIRCRTLEDPRKNANEMGLTRFLITFFLGPIQLCLVYDSSVSANPIVDGGKNIESAYLQLLLVSGSMSFPSYLEMISY